MFSSSTNKVNNAITHYALICSALTTDNSNKSEETANSKLLGVNLEGKSAEGCLDARAMRNCDVSYYAQERNSLNRKILFFAGIYAEEFERRWLGWKSEARERSSLEYIERYNTY